MADAPAAVDWGMVGGVTGIAALFVSVILTLLLWRYGEVKSAVRDDASRAALLKKVNGYGQAAQNWLDAVAQFNRFLDQRFFADGGRHGFRAFARCYILALIYPTVLTILAWITGDQQDFGGFALDFVQTTGWPERLWRGALVLLLAGVAGYFSGVVFSLGDDEPPPGRAGAWVHQRLSRIRRRSDVHVRNGWWNWKRNVIHPAISATVAFATSVAVTVAVIVVQDGGVAVAGAATVALAGFVAVTSAVTVAVAAAVVGALAVALALAEFVDVATGPALLLISLLSLFPILNTIADWLSWLVTRFLLKQAVKKTGSPFRAGMRLLAELIADLVFALAALILLAAMLGAAFEAWNLLAGPGNIINWRAMAETAIAAPLTEGLLVTGMLITTFLPTIAHLVYCISGMRFAFRPKLAKLRADLRREVISELDAQRIARRLVWLGVADYCIGVAAALSLTGGFLWLAWLFTGDYGALLYRAASFAAALTASWL